MVALTLTMHFMEWHCTNHDVYRVLAGEEALGPVPFVLETYDDKIALMSFDPAKVCGSEMACATKWVQ